jgi:hypothetical protein
VNNNLIDDAINNSSENLLEISIIINHENNLCIYRNEIQFLKKNNNLNIYSYNKKGRFHKFLKDDNSNNNYLVLKTLNKDNYFDEIVPNKDKTIYYKYKPNTKCDFNRDRLSYIWNKIFIIINIITGKRIKTIK